MLHGETSASTGSASGQPLYATTSAPAATGAAMIQYMTWI
ncbi:hypothetical protein P11VFA_033 [Rhizobium phage P11VFA]|nr:hypothetical protein P11VFA_033 [Rhizobium phage P11VFA]